jgi:nitrous oxidase accessory protein NosD
LGNLYYNNKKAKVDSAKFADVHVGVVFTPAFGQ